MATIREIAKAAGVSPSTVSRVLRAKPPYSEETRILVEETLKHFEAQNNPPIGSAVTMRDVAVMANVSISTVSNVLNHYPVSNESKEKVQQAIAALDYKPNIIGRTLRREQNNRVIAFTSNATWQALQGIYTAAKETGFEVLLMHSGINQPEEAAQYLEGGLAKGILFFDYFNEQVVENFAAHYRVVQCGNWTNAPNVNMVTYDYCAVGRELTQLLLKSKSKRIAMITGQSLRGELVGIMCQCENGYTAALQQAGIVEKKIYDWGKRIFYAFDYQFLDRFIHECMQEPSGIPDAFLVPTGEGASVLVHALQNHGFRVPEDIAVAAFLATDNSKASFPYITTMREDWYTLGYESVKLLTDLIATGSNEFQKIIVPHSILVRGSTNSELAPYGEYELISSNTTI